MRIAHLLLTLYLSSLVSHRINLSDYAHNARVLSRTYRLTGKTLASKPAKRKLHGKRIQIPNERSQ